MGVWQGTPSLTSYSGADSCNQANQNATARPETAELLPIAID
jgi:hypothetical protein